MTPRATAMIGTMCLRGGRAGGAAAGAGRTKKLGSASGRSGSAARHRGSIGAGTGLTAGAGGGELCAGPGGGCASTRATSSTSTTAWQPGHSMVGAIAATRISVLQTGQRTPMVLFRPDVLACRGRPSVAGGWSYRSSCRGERPLRPRRVPATFPPLGSASSRTDPAASPGCCTAIFRIGPARIDYSSEHLNRKILKENGSVRKSSPLRPGDN